MCVELNPLSVRIAQAVIEKFVAAGAIADGQVTVREGNALHEAVPRPNSVDLFISETLGAGLLDERGPEIFSRFASCIKREGGSTIPHRVKLSATLVPTNQGISHAKEGKPAVRYPSFVINTNGTELPVIPTEEWVPLEKGKEIPLTQIPKRVEGSINLPADIAIAAFDKNYTLAVCAEFVIDQDGVEVAARYETFITSPTTVGLVVVPSELQNEDPASLEVRFSFDPGKDSRESSYIEVARKGHV